MSATETESHATTSLSDTLQDYEIRVTGADDLPQHHWVPLTDHEAPPDVENPPDWPTDQYRGVPNYRPINYGLDLSQRPWGADAIGTAFVTTMFTGVFLQATAAWIWGHTGGRVHKTLFRYKIGGEI
ncbi:hypothetical protein F4810DRAFT_696934 [Camillea tinctor]|nr:hypothetical protein F4810DRAFT_696934 [Camillea tinctor]